MKKTTLLLLFILQYTYLFSQNQAITKIWGSPTKGESVSDIFEVNNNAFFVSASRDFSSPIVYSEGIILKLDSNCNLTGSFKLMNYLKRGKYYSIRNFFNYKNRIIGLGYAIDTLSKKNNVWLSEFDEDLNIIYDTLLGNSDSLDNLYTVNALLTSENKILLTLGFVPSIHDTINVQVILLDSNFNVLKENTIFAHFWFNGFSVVEMPSNQSFHIVTMYGITQINQNNLSVDSIVWSHELGTLLGGLGAKPINDSTYIHPLTSPFMTGTSYGMGLITYLYIRDKNGKTKDSIIIGDIQKSYDKTGDGNVDFFTTDSIFVTGSNYSLDSTLLSYEDNCIFLWNININGQVNWQKYYGIGKKFYVSDITKTSDGGCFLVGSVWDWHNIPDYTKTDVFFLKVDRNGNITGSLGINEKITQSEILVYPNPAKEKITFNTGMYQHFHLSIFNSLGQCVLQQQCTSSQQIITIQGYPEGMYYYKLEMGKGKVISGKFVKE